MVAESQRNCGFASQFVSAAENAPDREAARAPIQGLLRGASTISWIERDLEVLRYPGEQFVDGSSVVRGQIAIQHHTHVEAQFGARARLQQARCQLGEILDLIDFEDGAARGGLTVYRSESSTGRSSTKLPAAS